MRAVLSWAARRLLRDRPRLHAGLSSVRAVWARRELPLRGRAILLVRLLLAGSWTLVDTPANSARFARFVAYMRTTSRPAQ